MVPGHVLIKRVVELTCIVIVAAVALLAWMRG
jgi:hypothetical protein